MEFAVYKESTGEIISWGVVPMGTEHLQPRGSGEAIVTGHVRSPDLDYVTSLGIEPRPQMSILVDRYSIRANSTEEATLSGFPDPCTVSIDGEEHSLAGGTLILAANAEGSYMVSCQHWPYIRWEVTIEAVAV